MAEFGTSLEPMPRLAGRRLNAEEEQWMLANGFEKEAGALMSLRRGLRDGGIGELNRLRADKYVPNSLSEAFGNIQAPENSEPEYSLSGSYQPEVAYGE